jgi:hypothetical protein
MTAGLLGQVAEPPGQDRHGFVERVPCGESLEQREHRAAHPSRERRREAAAVAQGRADWGIAIDTVAAQYGLGFIPMQEEHYDFVVPKARAARPAVRAFIVLLQEPAVRQRLVALGFRL